MGLRTYARQAISDFVRSIWVRVWGRIEARVAPIEGRLALIEGALNVMQRDPAAFFGATSIPALSISIPAVWHEYEAWITNFDRLESGENEVIRRHIAGLSARPKFSILVRVTETPSYRLDEMIVSVRGQIYEHWELCLVVDAPRQADVGALLERPGWRDRRVKVVAADDIRAAGNSTLDLATGEYVALMDPHDVLAPHALAMMADAIDRHRDADILYSDEDKLDGAGRRYDPFFKPDWNAELLLGQNFISHLGVFRTALVRSLQGFALGLDGRPKHDQVLRLAAAAKGPIVHLPHVLYHKRQVSRVGTYSTVELGQIQRATLASRPPLDSLGKPPPPTQWPRVSAIIPTRDHAEILSTCLAGLLELTDYPDLEVFIADNDSSDSDARALFAAMERRGVRVIPCPGEFNYSKINNEAARHATGDIILFLNNDVEIAEPGWLKAMISHFASAQIGAVGAKLLYPDGTLQHGGVALGVLGVAGHVHLGAAGDSPGYFGRLRHAQDVSCVTAACMAVRRTVFEHLGGFDEPNLAVDFNDVDLCIRIRAAGHRIIWTPQATLVHHESKSRGSAKEAKNRRRLERAAAYMRRRWSDVLAHDPFWNPNLSLHSTEPRVAFPPRVSRPWRRMTVV